MTPEQAIPMIECSGLTKRYGAGQTVLDSVNLSISKGEFVSLIGPSGCGKSTALKLISGLAVPTGGTISVDGMTPKNAREIISFIFQDATLLPWRTVQQNVGLGLELEGVMDKRRREKTSQLLELVGLQHMADAYPRELSGGMKMRVSIARALVTDPKLLLMDEPFAALDEITRFKLNNDLLELWQTLAKTVVFVTHSVFESVYLSRRIVVMTPRPGRVFTELSIDAPYPRDESFRTSAEYAGYCRKTSQALAAAMAQGAGA